MRHRTILSLCDASGVWSRPYAEAGYDVRRFDLQDGTDIRHLEYPGPVHGILAAPPCTVFSKAGLWRERSPEELLEGLSVVDACLRLVAVCRPSWWALENPAGRLRRYLGPPRFRFDPCDYGDPWTKGTYLWGVFAEPMPDGLWVGARSVHPSQGDRTTRLTGTDKAQRSKTPEGFARAFFACNP